MMNSKEQTKPILNPSPLETKRGPYKFLTRNLYARFSAHPAFQQIRVKRFYLKKIIDRREGFSCLKGACNRLYKNNKLLKTLKSVQMPADFQLSAFEGLKGSRKIQDVFLVLTNVDRILDGNSYISLKRITHYFKKFPVTVREIYLSTLKDDDIEIKDIYSLARSIRYLPNLKSFQRHNVFAPDLVLNHVSKELRAWNQSVSRLKKIDGVKYWIGENEYDSFKRAMRREKMFPGVTELQIRLDQSDFSNFQRRMENFDFYNPENNPDFDFNNLNNEQKEGYLRIQDEIRKRDRQKEDNTDVESVGNSDFEDDERITMLGEDFLNSCLRREEIRPLFRFALFPNLKQLILRQETLFYPLDSFVVDGFAALRNLESLTIDLNNSSSGAKYIFQGLLKLPLLKELSFSASCIENDQWKTLKKFVRKQKNLEFLALSHCKSYLSKKEYQQENKHLQALVKGLDNKPLLKSLSLRSRVWSLKSLSKGLAHLNMINQLHSFDFEVCDASWVTKEKFQKRIGGLCDFIKNQKLSLKTLQVELPYIWDEEIVTTIAQATSELVHLRQLVLSWNYAIWEERNVIEATLFEHMNPCDFQAQILYLLFGEMDLAKAVRRLEKLEDFTLLFDTKDINTVEGDWLVDLMRTLSTLKSLRNVRIKSHNGKILKQVEQRVVPAIKEMTQIQTIYLGPSDREAFQGDFPTLKSTLIEVNTRQAQRSDLMF